MLLDDPRTEPGRLALEFLERAQAGRRPLAARTFPPRRAQREPAATPSGSSNRSVSRRCDALIVSSDSQSTIRPRSRSATWSDTRSTSSSKCDEKSTVRPSSAIVRMIAARISRRTIGSRPVDGSSSTKSSGRYASAASRPTRARWPCESVLIRARDRDRTRRRRSSAKPSSQRRVKRPQVAQQLRRAASSRAGRGPRSDNRPGPARRPARAPGRARTPAPSRSEPSRDRAGA